MARVELAFPQPGNPEGIIQTIKGLGERDRFRYEHDLLWYGLDAMMHMGLMATALHSVSDNTSASEFIERFKIQFSGSYLRPEQGFIADAAPLQAAGLFLPADKGTERIFFHAGDHQNAYNALPHYGYDVEQFKYWTELGTRQWTTEDFMNRKLLQQGLQYGFEMWRFYAPRFNTWTTIEGKFPAKGTDSRERFHSAKLRRTIEPLLGYYEDIARDLMDEYGPKEGIIFQASPRS